MSTPTPATPAKNAPTREELFPACEQIATSTNILNLSIGELNRAGFAGEERASRLIFLALVSRLFDEPISIAVKGPSSAGKSHTVKEVLKFFKGENYLTLTSMSEKALAYINEPMKHRFLVICEAEGMNGPTASYMIRTLLSEGCIKHRTVVQTKDEGWKPKTLCLEGPTGLLTTTTLPSLHSENETRVLSVPVNDSPEQTRRIMKARARRKPNVEMNYSPWHVFQEWIEVGPRGVTIPFAEELADRAWDGAVRLRRDFGKVLGLISAHALMHQYSRPMVNGTIEATQADYAAVYALIADLIAEGAERSVSDSVRETVEAVPSLAISGGVSITSLAKALKLDKSSASRRVQDAIEKGFLVNEEDRQGFPAKILLGDPLPEEQEVLPRPETLAA